MNADDTNPHIFPGSARNYVSMIPVILIYNNAVK